MKESYVEGLATHNGPKSCVAPREGGDEAWTVGRAGRVLSRVIHAPRREVRVVRGAEAVGVSRRPHRRCRIGEAAVDPARSETLRTRASTLFGNREVPRSSVPRWEASGTERIEKPMGIQR